jgi:hypothetical protein
MLLKIKNNMTKYQILKTALVAWGFGFFYNSAKE